MHPDGADELFLSCDVLSPSSSNADHVAQSPAGVPCPLGNADRKVKPITAWDPSPFFDESDLVAETSLSLKRANSLPEPGRGQEAASQLNELPRDEKLRVGGWLGVASPSTTPSLHLAEDRHKTECRESLCDQAQSSQCFDELEPTRPSSGRRFQADGINCGEGCGNPSRRRRIERLTRAVCQPSFRAVQQEIARRPETGDFASRRYEVLTTRTLEGLNAMSCSYNCVADKFSILQGTVVVWSGRWKDKCVCPSSDHINCIVRPLPVIPATSRVEAARAHPFWQVISGKKCLTTHDRRDV
jgi:hypothetical protein